ncbi:beta-N-acetylhexosaminidase [Hyphomonas sp.]|uniref:beta-N-acetylhexosaminidase n=1 Tax=Hyphomonas sp. TaxID=87 RepID=UPI003FA5BE0B
MVKKACILSVSGARLTSGEKALLSTHNPWGVILMGRSCVSKTQIRELVSDIWDATGRATLIFIDQEGGRVARLKAPEWPLFPRGEDYALLYQADRERGLEAAWLGHRLIAAELAAMSIHADCAPVVDLPVPGAHDVIGDRAFGTTPEQVADLGRAALKGLADGGVAGVIKHIPGHGRSVSDSHLELPRVTASEDELARDFEAFARLADAPMAMTAHIAYDSIDYGVVATLSPKLIQGIIRERIGFDGLLMTDDLGMRALGGSLTTRADGAIAAGCDVLLHCSGFLKDENDILAEMTEVAEASPLLAGKALQRADRAEVVAANEQSFDGEAGWARFHELFPAFRAMA